MESTGERRNEEEQGKQIDTDRWKGKVKDVPSRPWGAREDRKKTTLKGHMGTVERKRARDRQRDSGGRKKNENERGKKDVRVVPRAAWSGRHASASRFLSAGAAAHRPRLQPPPYDCSERQPRSEARDASESERETEVERDRGRETDERGVGGWDGERPRVLKEDGDGVQLGGN